MKYISSACRLVLLSVIFSCIGSSVYARPFAVQKLFNHNMVLQHGQPLPVWGWSESGDTVMVSFGSQTVKTKSGRDGTWQAKLKPLDVSSVPATMTIRSETNDSSIVITNILVGDVWLCSGQSNMECPVYNPDYWLYESTSGKFEAAAANYPAIRLFTVNNRPSADQSLQDDVIGEWTVCSPETVADFSGVGYFFGRELHTCYKIPVGLIDNSWGGTPAEAWTSRQALEQSSVLKPIIKKFDAFVKSIPELDRTLIAYGKKRSEIYKKLFSETSVSAWDKGMPVVTGSTWKTVSTPGKHIMNAFDGVAWLVKKIAIPEEMRNKPALLSLGPVDDHDITYVNGIEVGRMGLDVRGSFDRPRRYPVPASCMEGSNVTIAVRVGDNIYGGGFGGKATQMFLVSTGTVKADPIPLAGTWKMCIEKKMPAEYARAPGFYKGPAHQESPSALYNCRINPLLPLALKGVIWYQGESNADRARQYHTLFPAMVQDWRRAWGRQDLPFLYVQLANFLFAQRQPTNHPWAELREAQLQALKKIPHSAMAVIIDIGEARNIHPHNKQDVGKRLSLAARKMVYGEDIVYSGPLYKNMKIEGDSIRIFFDHTGSGLKSRNNDPLKRFAIAGKDKNFVWANATIDGNTVVVSSGKLKHPVAVRYAWETNPDGCNLYNKEGLPASPFRTDTWPGLTDTNQVPRFVFN